MRPGQRGAELQNDPATPSVLKSHSGSERERPARLPCCVPSVAPVTGKDAEAQGSSGPTGGGTCLSQQRRQLCGSQPSPRCTGSIMQRVPRRGVSILHCHRRLMSPLIPEHVPCAGMRRGLNICVHRCLSQRCHCHCVSLVIPSILAGRSHCQPVHTAAGSQVVLSYIQPWY